ncbi:MAG: hypothetical protein U1F83_06730 [Verrucomicrobiota bacterium]
MIQSATNITVGDGSLGGRNIISATTSGSGVSALGGGGHFDSRQLHWDRHRRLS